jgi:hypothetical protein
MPGTIGHYELPKPRIRYARYRGQMDEAERDRIRNTPLYQMGDTILVWVNGGDLCMIGANAEYPVRSTNE